MGRLRIFLSCLGGLAFVAAGAAVCAEPVVLPPVAVTDGVAEVVLGEAPVPTDRPIRVPLVFPPGPKAPVVSEDQQTEAERLLARLIARGVAAGHHGDLYDNRDRAHSNLPIGKFPQLVRTIYGPRLTEVNLDYGAAGPFLFDAPVIGNSSTALTAGPLWRSQGRLLLTRAGGPEALYQAYRAGQIYVYPEHRDHDPAWGDLFPANTPYFLISQGSSSSDQTHLHALALILAAFQPQTKARLIEEGLLGAAVQMVYRRSRAPVLSRAAYLNGAAHPSVFDGAEVNGARAVTLANAMAADAIPPLVTLDVLEESWTAAERFFDTPAAVARIWRAEAGRQTMVVTAAGTRDPNGRDLAFEWVVLRGDPSKVRVNVQGGGRAARIEVDWQAAGSVPGAEGLLSSRVDIGVFASNGIHNSAPSFVSILLPRHERRVYGPGPEGPILREIDRGPRPDVYADPILFPEIQ